MIMDRLMVSWFLCLRFAGDRLFLHHVDSMLGRRMRQSCRSKNREDKEKTGDKPQYV